MLRRLPFGRAFFSLLTVAALALASGRSEAQFIPYYGKNKIRYDSFAWRVYKSPHFEIFYYPQFEPQLARVASYAESAYQKISQDLKHTLNTRIPLIVYKTHAEFEQTNLFPSFVPEGVAAFAEPQRNRMVLPIDEPSDRLQGLITHELTHVFEFDLIPRSLMQRQVPLWVDEGLADHMRSVWDPLDLMMIRDAAVTDQIPRVSRLEDEGNFSSPRMIYNLGHAAFEYIQARYGKEGIRQFLYTLRKNSVGGKAEDLYQQAFRCKPDEFDQGFDKWLKDRFKPYRDKQRPTDYDRDISPDSEKTPFTQVFAFSPSPSGELVAALTGNRSDGELDLVLLSTTNGAVIKNLTKGFTNRYEDFSFSDDFTAGRTIDFDPQGDAVAFFARTGKRRSLFLVSALTGQVLQRALIPLDQPQSPCLLADGRRVLLTALKEGVSDVYLLDLKTRQLTNLTQDEFFDSDPQISPDGSLVVYSRRVSGHTKLMLMPLGDPTRRTQLTFGAHDDAAPIFAADGHSIYFASDEEGDIFNLRSLDLRTGVIREFTDVLGGNMAPAPLKGRDSERLAFISYYKGEYRLRSLDTREALREVDQEVQRASAESIDFQPDVVHQLVAENKRRKHAFEKFVLENRPPINVGVTSGGDFFGGSQLNLSDVLGDHSVAVGAWSVREYRSYQADYLNLSRRLNWGISFYDQTIWGYADPYGYLYEQGFGRQGALTTQRYSGAMLMGQYPLDKFRRLEFSVGIARLREGFASADAEQSVRQQSDFSGVPLFLNNGTLLPLAVGLTQETTRFHEFGPLSGSTYSVSLQATPGWGRMLSRTTVQVDARKYFRLLPTTVLAARFRGFRSAGEQPDYFFFGGNMELRGYPYLSFAGNQGFHANLELRLPVIDLMKTPLGIMGPVRGTIYAGLGGANFKGQSFRLASRALGYSYVNDTVFGEPVEGYHLVDGRASYGVGLQLFLFGYPLHFDWTKLTDFKIVSQKTYFNFWIGYDF